MTIPTRIANSGLEGSNMMMMNDKYQRFRELGVGLEGGVIRVGVLLANISIHYLDEK